jgi:hypothetical protein
MRHGDLEMPSVSEPFDTFDGISGLLVEILTEIGIKWKPSRFDGHTADIFPIQNVFVWVHADGRELPALSIRTINNHSLIEVSFEGNEIRVVKPERDKTAVRKYPRDVSMATAEKIEDIIEEVVNRYIDENPEIFPPIALR